MPEKLSTIYIVRHGQTEWNREGRLQGQKDSPLTPEGISEAQATAQMFADIDFAAIYSSDLFRAQKTAEIIKLNRNLAVNTNKALRERTFGDLDGIEYQKYEQATKHLLAEYQRLSDEEKARFKFTKGYETDEEIVTRFITFLREVSIAYPNKNVLVVTHGGTIRTLLVHLGYGTREELRPGTFKNAGFVKLKSDGVDFFIEEVNGVEK